MISLRIISTPANLSPEKVPVILTTLTQKMTSLMIRLQSRIVGESIPTFFTNGAPNIAATVRAIPAVLDGTVIHGEVQAGGPRTTKRTLRSGAEVDYAAVQEYGGRAAYDIIPFSKKALAFMVQGQRVVVKIVHHPPLEARPYMRSELQNSETQIVAELQAALGEALNS